MNIYSENYNYYIIILLSLMELFVVNFFAIIYYKFIIFKIFEMNYVKTFFSSPSLRLSNNIKILNLWFRYVGLIHINMLECAPKG